MRKSFLLILLVLLTVSGAALAQDTGTVFCGDLAEADCTLLQQSQTAMMNNTAASFDLFVDLQVNAEGQNIPISLVGSGAYSGMHAMGSMSADNMGSIEDALANLRDFNGELMLSVTVPQELAGDSDTPNTLTLELRLVEGVGYINFDPLQPLINDPSLSGWGGLDLAGLLGAVVEENPDMFSQLGEMATGGMDPMMMQQFSDPAFFGQYASITRTDDASGDSATFETTIDFAGFMSDPAFEDLMRQQMESQMDMMGGEGMSEDEMQEALEMSRQIFQNSNFVVRQEVETATGLTRSLSVEFDIDMTGMEGMDEDEAVAFNLTAMINYDYEDVPTIAVPENVSILPYEQLLGMFNGMMGGMMQDIETLESAETELATPEATPAG